MATAQQTPKDDSDEPTDPIPDEGETNVLDRVTDPAFQFNTRATPIRLFFRVVDVLVDEAKVKVGTAPTAEWDKSKDVDGVHVKAVDPANVAMVNATMPKQGGGFDKWNVPLDTQPYHVLGVNNATMFKNLKYGRMAGKGVADDGDPIAVRYGDDLRRLETVITRPNQRSQRVTSWNLIDPDSVRQEPDIPDLSAQLNNVGHFESTRALKDAVGELSSHSDHVRVRADPDADGAFQFHADGDGFFRSDFVRFTDGHEVVDGDEDDARAESSLFSMCYLKDIASALHAAKMDKVVVRWGDEYPAIFQFFNEEYGIRGVFMLAPRIQSEDDEDDD